MPPDFHLPHGATGIEFGDFVIEFREDKVVALAKGTGEHYTLHLGPNSGVLDVHRTGTDAEGNQHHHTVFAMRHADIPPFLNELRPMLGDIFRLIRKLRLGWLNRHGIGIVRGPEGLSDEELAAVTRKAQRRKRIVFDDEKIRNNLRIPEYRDDLWDFPDGPFSLFSDARRIGIGFKVTDRSGWARLFWIKSADVNRFGRAAQSHLLAAAMKHAIPPQEYGRYGILE